MKNAFKGVVAAVVGFSVVLLVSLSASAQNAAEGSTPLAIAPGSPAGSYALSDFDSINLYNGGMNFALPLAKIAGRGAAGHTMTAHIQVRWLVERGESDSKQALYYPNSGGWNDAATSIYSMGFLYIRQASKGWIYGCNSWNIHQETLTRLTFTTPDGTEYELRDQLTNGQPAHPTCTPGFNRGKVFVTSDGTSATFTSDTDISDVDAQFNDPIDYQPPAPSGSGYLVTREGTRYRIDGGIVTWMRDRNGNKTIFAYDGYGRVTTITDSLNRQTTIAYAQQTGAGYDLISFKGFGATTRTIKVYGAYLQSALRSGYSLQTYQQLFPELNGSTTATSNPPVINAIELPNGKQYHFYYNSYAELARVELPTGGAIEYDYAAGSTDEAQSGVLLFTNSPYSRVIYRRIVERRMYPNGGSGATYASKITYSRPESSTSNAGYVRTDQYDSSGALTRADHYFYGSARGSFNQQPTGYPSWSDGREYQTTEYAENGATSLRQVVHAFAQRAVVNWWSGDPNLAPPNDPRPTETDTILTDTNQVSKQTFGYDDSVPFNNRNNLKEYDFGSGTAGALLRETRTTFVTAPGYIGSDVSLLSLPSQVSIYDAGTERARTVYEYDNYGTDTHHAALMSRAAISGMDSSFSSSYNTRGNVTATTKGLGTDAVSTYSQYDIAGNVVKAIDGRGYPTTMDFSDRFGSPDGEARSNNAGAELAGQSSYAFPTLVSNALGHAVYTQYDYYLGRAVEVEDANGVVSSGYFNDLLDRPTQLTRASNQAAVKSQTIFSYDDTGRTITTTSDQNSFADGALSSGTVYDGFGRVSQTRVASIYTDTTYDGLGRVRTRSNAHLTATSPTDGNTTYTYDSLGRTKLVTEQDAVSTVQTSYLGSTTTATDQAGKKRKSSSDALGRLTAVWEDPNGSNYETDYRYDALGNLTRVIQGGLQDRVSTYDSLSRLITAYNPESGTTCYGIWSGSNCLNGYDGNGNLLKKTDARGVTTTFAYDPLNRLLSKQYSDATKSACFQYDQSSLATGSPNLIGRMTNEWTQAGACPSSPPPTGVTTENSVLAYDANGHVKQEQQCTPLNCNGASAPFPLIYNYDLAGNIIQSTNGMVSSPSVILTYAYDTANHLRTVSSSWNDADHPGTLYSASPWGPIGVTDFTLGAASQVHRDYNNRTWLYNQAVQGKTVQGASSGTSTFNISFSEQGQDTPATGSVTVGGSEQSTQVLSQAAAAGSTSVTITGAERSTQITVQNATQATGNVTISGAPQHKKVFDPDFGGWYYVDNLGPVSVTVNGFTKSAYANTTTDTSAVVASKLATAFNADGNSPVTASASGSVVYLTSKATGTAANYSLSASCSYDTTYFTSCAFTGAPSGSALTGGQNAIINTVYDTGTASLTINGFGKSVAYGQGSSASTVASALVNAFNGDGSSPVTAGLSGSTIIATAKQTGAGTNYGFSTSSGTTSGYFSGSSFAASPGSGALGGGRDATYNTVYDSGSNSVSVNGYSKSASYGQGSAASALASAIASAFTNDGASPVTASANGGTISFTTRQLGSGVNYSLSTGVSYDAGNFTQASFAGSPSGSALTGGLSNGIHDAGTITMAVNSPVFSKTVSYGTGDTAALIALRLASAYTNDSNSPVTVSANGAALTITSKQAGAGTNYGLTFSQTHDTVHFSSASFTGPSTATLSGGTDSSFFPAQIYSFNVSSFQPNGNIQTVGDSVTGTWTYGYDAFNRLTTGNATAGQCSGMNLTWGYDRFGNRTSQSASGTSGCSIVQPTYSFSGANNRIDGWSYDAAGNLLADTAHTYTYDAENRIDTIVNGTQYIYDAEGRRVAKSNAGALLANYILGLGGEQITEMNGTGQWVHSNVFAGTLAATYDNTGTHFHISDWLGTRRVQAGTNGVTQGSYFSYPFGDGLAVSGADATEHHFTGKERDSESGLDYFGARYTSSGSGRFMSPDWSESPDSIPYAAIDVPQSLNLYSYVQNNPLSNTDPDGHDCVVQTKTSSDTESVSVTSGNCDNVEVGDGQSKTYIAGEVDRDSIKSNGSGGITFGYTGYDKSSGVADLNGAPTPDHPGLAYGYNAEGYKTLARASNTVKDIGMAYAAVYGGLAACAAACPALATAATAQAEATASAAEAQAVKKLSVTLMHEGVQKAAAYLSALASTPAGRAMINAMYQRLAATIAGIAHNGVGTHQDVQHLQDLVELLGKYVR